MPSPAPETRFDIRQYLALLVFRWRLIVLVLLLSVAATAVYIQYVPPVYEATCSLMISRDPHLDLGVRAHSPLQQFQAHTFLLNSEALKNRAMNRVARGWDEDQPQWRGLIMPEVFVGRGRGLRSSLSVRARGADGAYLKLFLAALLEEHEQEWRSLQTEASESAVAVLEKELAEMELKIARAEDELIEYQRLHDIARIEAIGRHESSQLMALIQRKGQLSTEIMMLEAQNPFLRDADAGLIEQVDRMTRETTMMLAPSPSSEMDDAGDRIPMLHPMLLTSGPADEVIAESMRDWQDLRVRLARLQESENELARNFTAEHPRLQEVRREIADVRERLDTQARVRMQRLIDRRAAMEIQLQALDGAEQNWQARNLLASRRRSELNRIAAVVRRFEGNYNTLYARLHDLRVNQELSTESFRIVSPIAASNKPVWPDPVKLLLMSLVLGGGAGLGLAIGFGFIDNKIQIPNDIEKELRQQFLGGVPFWAHSHLEAAVRPIVIEREAESAIESYRNLRTTVLSALGKLGEKVAIVTSADSREGKTLTTLNIAILTAMMGKKVLLLDMDIRRGCLHRSMKVPRTPGISEVLTGHGSLRDVIVPTAIANLDFAPSGKHSGNIAELLHGLGLRALLSDVADAYDYIFIDTSPLLRVSESVVLCNSGVGAVVMVARVGRTPKPLIRYALGMIADARIVGVIVNNIMLNRISGLYYAYQYPNASYSYYEYGRYGDTGGTRSSRGWRRWRQRLMQWSAVGRSLPPAPDPVDDADKTG